MGGTTPAQRRHARQQASTSETADACDLRQRVADEADDAIRRRLLVEACERRIAASGTVDEATRAGRR